MVPSDRTLNYVLLARRIQIPEIFASHPVSDLQFIGYNGHSGQGVRMTIHPVLKLRLRAASYICIPTYAFKHVQGQLDFTLLLTYNLNYNQHSQCAVQ